MQVAAALIIAHSDPNWSPSSLRHKTLRSLVFGPTDWSVSAAIIALGVVATETPAIRSEIIRWFQQLRSQIPKEGFTCYEYPLVSTWLAIGGHDADAQTDLEAWRQRIWDGQTGGTRVLKTELRPPQFNQEDEMNKARAAQRQLDQDAVPADPVVFPGQKVERLSDYVTLMKKMQAGDMLTALGQFGLDMQTYSHVMTVWGQRLQAEAPLNARFAQMMAQG